MTTQAKSKVILTIIGIIILFLLVGIMVNRKREINFKEVEKNNKFTEKCLSRDRRVDVYDGKKGVVYWICNPK